VAESPDEPERREVFEDLRGMDNYEIDILESGKVKFLRKYNSLEVLSAYLRYMV